MVASGSASPGPVVVTNHRTPIPGGVGNRTRSPGSGTRPAEVAAELDFVLRRDPGLVLIAQDGRGMVGSVFGAYDGRRGRLNRLATRPDGRGEGIAAALVAALEQALEASGCRKLNLLIEPTNAGVVSFYQRHGYAVDELIFMEEYLPGPIE